MDWQRERDGLVVVVAVVVLLVAVAVGNVRGFATTFVATFLGFLAALRVNDWIGAGQETAGAVSDTAVAPAAVGEVDAAESPDSVGPAAGAPPADADETTREGDSDDARSGPADENAAVDRDTPTEPMTDAPANGSESDATDDR